jgi:Flp pilus assembly protein TadD
MCCNPTRRPRTRWGGSWSPRGNAANGVALLRQATTEASNDPRVVYHYAVALKDTGDKNEAIKELSIVVGLKGTTAKEKDDAQRLLTDLKVL